MIFSNTDEDYYNQEFLGNLIYNSQINTENVENVLLISSAINEKQLFYESANNNTFPIIYFPNSKKDELIKLFKNKFQNGIKRISFAFHGTLNNSTIFLDQNPLFNETDLSDNIHISFSENVVFVTNLIIEFNVKNCDFLACNSLKYSNWNQYYNLITKITNVICGASNNTTGNIQYGADWVLENTNENIKHIYFNNFINNYAAYLDDIFTINYLMYTIIPNTTNVSVTGYTTPPLNWDLNIPSVVTHPTTNVVYNVITLNYAAFYNCSALKSIVISSSVTNISNNVFFNCISLTNIIIPTSVTSIGNNAFNNCSALTSVTIPNSVTTIKDSTFSGCSSLSSVTIPNSIISIEQFAFNGCIALTSITIPNSVINISSYIFNGCSSLTSIIIPNSVTSISTGMFQNCSKLTNITIPNSITSINNYAFNNCSSLTSILFPSSVTFMGVGIFRDCKELTSIIIPMLVTNISVNMFQNCFKLISITIPNSIISIGNNAFENCYALSSITIPNLVTNIGNNAFLFCKELISITIPNSVTSIGDTAFQNCFKLSNIIISNTITNISIGMFANCIALTNCTIPNSVTRINNYAFNGCIALASITIPPSVISMGSGVFMNCRALISVILPNSITTISENMFLGCSSLSNITLPNSVTSIEQSAFNSCSALANIIIPVVVTSIGNNAFDSCVVLANITIPNTLISIGANAFCNCNILSNISIPNSVTNIGNSAFQDCYELKSVRIPNLITTISNNVFFNCKKLTNVRIPSSVTSIGQSAFAYCAALKIIIIPELVTSIGDGAFFACGLLSGVYFLRTEPLVIGANNFVINNDIAYYNGTNISHLSMFTTIVGFQVIQSVITNFNIQEKTFGNSSFAITNPSSNNIGLFMFSSNNLSVADINTNIITINGAGTADITVAQDTILSGLIVYKEATKTTTFVVKKAIITLTDFNISPTQINIYSYFSIINPISISSGLFSYISSNQLVSTITGNNIKIVGTGISTITVTQAETANYTSATITKNLQVDQLLPTITNINSIFRHIYTSTNQSVNPLVQVISDGVFDINATQPNPVTITTQFKITNLIPVTSFSISSKIVTNSSLIIINPSSNINTEVFSFDSYNLPVAIINGFYIKIISINVNDTSTYKLIIISLR